MLTLLRVPLLGMQSVHGTNPSRKHDGLDKLVPEGKQKKKNIFSCLHCYGKVQDPCHHVYFTSLTMILAFSVSESLFIWEFLLF